MNHHRLNGPTLFNFSGGLTSAFMLHLALQAHGGALPDDTFVVFTNTGRERHATLDFVSDVASRWGVDVRWIERRAGGSWEEVDYEHAARDGEPFAELITERRYLPNAITRFCTVSLKIEPAAAFMRSQGFERWTSVLGLRFDEARRVANVRGRDHGSWDVACPLYDARITRAEVEAFWRAQPFKLRLAPWEGNCDLCFLKGRARRERIMRDHPELVTWWATQEARVGGRFHAHEPGYARTLEAVTRLPMLAMDIDAEDNTIPCTCTERRRPRRCRCGARRGQGHALACPMVWAEAA